jgi:hypothetical protein
MASKVTRSPPVGCCFIATGVCSFLKTRKGDPAGRKREGASSTRVGIAAVRRPIIVFSVAPRPVITIVSVLPRLVIPIIPGISIHIARTERSSLCPHRRAPSDSRRDNGLLGWGRLCSRPALPSYSGKVRGEIGRLPSTLLIAQVESCELSAPFSLVISFRRKQRFERKSRFKPRRK